MATEPSFWSRDTAVMLAITAVGAACGTFVSDELLPSGYARTVPLLVCIALLFAIQYVVSALWKA